MPLVNIKILHAIFPHLSDILTNYTVVAKVEGTFEVPSTLPNTFEVPSTLPNMSEAASSSIAAWLPFENSGDIFTL